jgi:MORN repeat variant
MTRAMWLLAPVIALTGTMSSNRSVPLPVIAAHDPALLVQHSVTRWHGALFTGRVDARDDDGTLTATTYRNGVRDGAADQWYEGGVHSYHREYRNGREEGAHSGWWPDGSRRFAYVYTHGLLEGEAREWFASGQLARESHYLHGHEEGREQMWYEDGSLRSNYVMRSGRRFGLPGEKGCFGHDSAAAS